MYWSISGLKHVINSISNLFKFKNRQDFRYWSFNQEISDLYIVEAVFFTDFFVIMFLLSKITLIFDNTSHIWLRHFSGNEAKLEFFLVKSLLSLIFDINQIIFFLVA